MKKLLKLALTAGMAFSIVGCSGTTSEGGSTSSESLSEWHTYETLAREMTTWNFLHTQSGMELQVLTQFQDGLLTHDVDGKLQANLAETWEKNDDATVFTFHLREGVKWVDYEGNYKADLTSEDFITGLEYVLNYAKNSGANSSMAREMIDGAEEYYQLTSAEFEETGAVSAETEAKFLDIVGIECPDDYTVVYTMMSPKPYFDTLATYSTLYPLSAQAIEEYGENYGTDNKTIYYDGPYLCAEYEHNSHKKLVQNETWWNTTDKRFDIVTIQMVEDQSMAWSLFQTGEIDNVTLSEDALLEIYKQGDASEYYKYLVEAKQRKYVANLHFNYNSKLEDGSVDTNWNTAIANLSFRQCFYYGVDWTNYLKRYNTINPGKCIAETYTTYGLVYTSDGTDYQDLVKEKLGYSTDKNATSVHARVDADKYAEVKEQAITELSVQGVTFPVTMYYYYKAGDQTAADTAAVFEQLIEEQLDGLVTVEFRTYTDSASSEIIKPELWSCYISGWGADYGDPINYLAQEIDDTNAFYNYGRSDLTADIDPEFAKFNELVATADAITDLDTRYEAFAEAEVYFIEHAWAIPIYSEVSWEITRVNDYAKISGAYGSQSARYLNWETTSNIAYTTEEYEAFAQG